MDGLQLFWGESGEGHEHTLFRELLSSPFDTGSGMDYNRFLVIGGDDVKRVVFRVGHDRADLEGFT